MELAGASSISSIDRVAIFNSILNGASRQRLGRAEVRKNEQGYEFVVEDTAGNLCHYYFYNHEGTFLSSFSTHDVTPLVGSRELAYADFGKTADRYLRELQWGVRATSSRVSGALLNFIDLLFPTIMGFLRSLSGVDHQHIPALAKHR